MLMKNTNHSSAMTAVASTPPTSYGNVRRVLWQFWKWYERTRQREALAGLDRRLLDDIGISPEQRDEEVSKPFWR
jgi:uncharacterized protein YjiS (DUF1127 family)